MRNTFVGGLLLVVLAGLLVDTQSEIWPFHNGDGDVGIKNRPGRGQQVLLRVRQRPLTGESDIFWELNGHADTGRLQHQSREGGVWETLVRVKPSDRIILRAWQRTNEAELECWVVLVSNGRVIDHKKRADTGSIRCYFNRL